MREEVSHIIHRLEELQPGFEATTDKDRELFQAALQNATEDEKQKLYTALLVLTPEKAAKSKELEAQGFDLSEHLKNLVDKFSRVGPQRKAELYKRVDAYKENVAYMPDSRVFYSTMRPIPHDSESYKNNMQILQRLLDDFSQSGSPAGDILKEVLAQYDLVIEFNDDKNPDGSLRQDSASLPNGTALLNKKTKKLHISINNATFKEEYLNVLPGLLAHELGHAVDSHYRPEGYAGHIQGEETWADIYAQSLTESAGYDARSFAALLQKSDRREYLVADIRPSGAFRADTIKCAETEKHAMIRGLLAKIHRNVEKFSKIRDYYRQAFTHLSQEERVLSMTKDVYSRVLQSFAPEKLKEISPQTRFNKYCLMGLMDCFKKCGINDMVPDDFKTATTCKDFVTYCQQDPKMAKYLHYTDNVMQEKLQPGTLFIMTGLERSFDENAPKPDFRSLDGDNHATIYVGKNIVDGANQFSAFSEERWRWSPGTYHQGYCFDTTAYLKDLVRGKEAEKPLEKSLQNNIAKLVKNQYGR